MKKLTDELLAACISATLERMAFVSADRVDVASGQCSQAGALIEYSGRAERGVLLLRADSEFLIELASGMLGVDPSVIDPGRDGLQALDELANMVGGEVLLALGSQCEPYQLGLPQRETENEPQPEPAAACCQLRTETGSLEVRLWRHTLAIP